MIFSKIFFFRKTNNSPSLGVWGPSDKAEEETQAGSAPLSSSVAPPSSVESIVDEPKVIKPPPNLQPQSPSTYEPIQQNHVQGKIFYQMIHINYMI